VDTSSVHPSFFPYEYIYALRRYRVQSPDNTPTLGSEQEGQIKEGIEETRKRRIE
jgi:hypothetical protein